MVNFRPARRTIIIEAIDDIPSLSKNQEGFGIKSQRIVPEVPYKYKVIAVGAPGLYDGLMISSEVEPGDIISLNDTNFKRRETIDQDGFLIDGKVYYAIDFRDVLLIWEPLKCICHVEESGMGPWVDNSLCPIHKNDIL